MSEELSTTIATVLLGVGIGCLLYALLVALWAARRPARRTDQKAQARTSSTRAVLPDVNASRWDQHTQKRVIDDTMGILSPAEATRSWVSSQALRANGHIGEGKIRLLGSGDQDRGA